MMSVSDRRFPKSAFAPPRTLIDDNHMIAPPQGDAGGERPYQPDTPMTANPPRKVVGHFCNPAVIIGHCGGIGGRHNAVSAGITVELRRSYDGIMCLPSGTLY